MIIIAVQQLEYEIASSGSWWSKERKVTYLIFLQ